jgi:hypothetical protein
MNADSRIACLSMLPLIFAVARLQSAGPAGAPSFPAEITSVGANIGHVAFADMDGDGALDLVAYVPNPNGVCPTCSRWVGRSHTRRR